MSTLTLRPMGQGVINSTTYGTTYCANWSTAWEQVDEETCDDLSYFSVSQQGGYAQDAYKSFTLSNPSLSGTITNVTIYVRCAGHNTYSCYAKTLIYIGSTSYEGSIYYLNVDANYHDISTSYNTNPNTGVAWTWTDINNLEIGVHMRCTNTVDTRCSWVYAVVTYNAPPNNPSTPSGASSVGRNISSSYSTNTTDPEGNNIYYRFNWGDGTYTNSSVVASGTTVSASHSWSTATTYSVKVCAIDSGGNSSDWSGVKTVVVSNTAPNTPSTPSGSSSLYRNVLSSYLTAASDANGDQVKYTFDWDDGTTSTTGFVSSGTSASASHSWSAVGTWSVRAKTTDYYGLVSGWSSIKLVTVSNQVPNKPSTPSGTTNGRVGISYSYSTSATDPDGDDVYYSFTWGDGTSDDTATVASGTTASVSHSWSSPGTYLVYAYAIDIYAGTSVASNALTVVIGQGGGRAQIIGLW